jgi:hypothetical protein
MSITEIKYEGAIETATKAEPFYNGPAEFLVREIAKKLIEVEEFALVFGDSIYPYMRQDFSIRELPGMRIYNDRATKDFESWFLEGEIKCDVILPADIRRDETQQLQDTIAAALLQQFRRPKFFVEMGEVVPGLNELGKRFEYDKSLGFEWNDTVVPLTQITLNFKIDLRAWDSYLEQTNRTKDSPFKETLGDLRRLVGVIQGLRDDLEKELDLGTNQRPGVPQEE